MSRTPISTYLFLTSALLAGAAMAYWAMPMLDGTPPVAERRIETAKPGQAYEPSSEAGAFLIAQRAEQDSDWIATHRALLQMNKFSPLPPAQNARLFLAAIAAGDWATERDVVKNHPDAISGSAPIVPMLATIIAWSDNDPNAPAAIQKIGYNPISQIVLPYAQGWMTRETPKLGLMEAAQDIGYSTVNMVRFFEATKQYEKSDNLMIKLQEADLNIRLRAWSIAYFERRGLTEQAALTQAKFDAVVKDLPPQSWQSERAQALAEADGHLKSDKRALALTLIDATYFLDAHNASAIALLYAQTAMKLAPDLADGPMVLGPIYETQENWDEAYQAYTSVKKDNPAYLSAQLRAAEVLTQSDRLNEAKGLYDEIIDADPDSAEAWFNKGEFLRTSIKDYRGAIVAYDRTEKLLNGHIPDSYWTLYLARGLSYDLSGNPDKAIENYEQAHKLQPTNPEALNTLAYAWTEKGEHLDEAQTMLEQALQAEPGAPHIIDSLGWVLFKKGEAEKAVALLEQAAQMMPYDATVNGHLGDAYAAAGRRREALFMWQRGLDNAETDKERDAFKAKLND